MSEDSRICYVNSYSRSVLTNIKVFGVFSLHQISENIYLCEFSSCDDLHNAIADIDDLDIYSSHLSLNSDNGEQFEYTFLDNFEFNLIISTIEECKHLCDISLRLQSLVRDIYYSGVYSNAIHNLDINIMDNLLNQLENQFGNNEPWRIFEEPQFNEIIEDPTILDIKIDDLPNIICFYCSSKGSDITNEFLVHPYVPNNFDYNPIYMCTICVNLWKEYRDKAEADDGLKLEGNIRM